MTKDIRIDEPGAGEWIMKRASGYFTPECDHSISSHYRSDGKIRGGFALCGYLGASMTVHAAGDDEKWCSRDMLWMVFHYGFIQLGVRKLIAPVASNNYNALAINLRAGWTIETVVRDAYPDAHMLVLTMTRDRCPWLRVIPQSYFPGEVVRKLEGKPDGR